MPSRVVVYCDGACEPQNPLGYATWAWVAFVDGKEVNHAYGCLGHGEGMSNNVAEYAAVLEALRRAHAKQVALELYTDSQLVVNQVNGRWAVKASHLAPLRDEAANLLKATGSTLTWVRREQNLRADELSKLAYQKAREESHGR